jgi:hypothetical protein
MLTGDDIKALLADSSAMGLPAHIDDDTPIVVDSFALVWLKHVLAEEHGLVIEPQRSDLDTFVSVRGIQDYLARTFPDRVQPAGGGEGA